MAIMESGLSVHESKCSPLPKNFNPRRYQVEVFEVAKKRNIIAVLETGAGKTMTAVMLIKHIDECIKSTGQKKLIIFLAPTVYLVNQQSRVIREYTDLAVGEYHGDKGVDYWNSVCWEKELKEHDVMVMTPQILLDGLGYGFFKIETVGLMVIDECHHASRDHPYVKIMKEFYHRTHNKPKIFGLTASPVIGKVISSTMDCEVQMSTLESILDSKIYSIKDRTELELCVPSAKETCRFYDLAQFSSQRLKSNMQALQSEYEALLLGQQQSVEKQYKDVDDKLASVRKQLLNEHSKVLRCLDDLGLVCTYEATKFCLENSPNPQEDSEIYKESCLLYREFFNEVLRLIEAYFPTGNENSVHFGLDKISEAVELGYISPKLYELLHIFHSFGESNHVLCLIFVDRIVTAIVLDRFVKKVKFLSHLRVSYLTGSNTSADSVTPKLQKEILQLFSSGKLNLLFATDVVEEGIHVPNCSYVIRFDLPKTVRSYVQSRGRARQKNSCFITMLERGNVKQMDELFNIIRSEFSMEDTARNRDLDADILPPCIEDKDAYYVDATGARVTADSSVSLLYRYCEQLPSDKYFVPKPIFQVSYSGEFYECKLTLPPSAAFQTITGPPSKSSHLAKQLVCLEACKKLHQMGSLNDHLLPYLEDNMSMRLERSSSGDGTTKRKELHGTSSILALSGTWAVNPNGATFHAYKFDFSCNIIEEVYSGFVLLIESKLDYDVGNFELDLYLISKIVKTSVSSCEKLSLDEEQMRNAKCFQELFFNGLFGRLYVGSEEDGMKREFLLQHQTSKLWNPLKMYLLLPVQTLNKKESWEINWRAVKSSVPVIEFLKRKSQLSSEHPKTQILPYMIGSSNVKENSSRRIHFTNCSVEVDDVKDMAVLAIHSGRFYSIVEVATNTSAVCPLSYADAIPSEATSYIDYFNTTYGIRLMYPGQPLLRLKQSHKPHNLLVNFSEADASSSSNTQVVEKEQVHVYMPPEILLKIDIPIDVLKAFYLLPSLMHRVESLMLASQLRKEINFNSDSLHIRSSLILEALTTLKCCENFSLERLELLGDSVLKYAVNCHLFLRYPSKHEGQLSYWSSSLISNSALYRLGIDRKLQGYIRDSAFEPCRWVAPGQHCIYPVPCKCGVDTLEVPLGARFQTYNPAVRVGKCCDRGHRWMSSKTISDCVEAIVGAYYVDGGLPAAIHTIKWLGLDVQMDYSAITRASIRPYVPSIRPYVPKDNEIQTLESKLGYNFSTKSLLQEAVTHASQQELGVGYCYQRLEFLGDSVLGLILSLHLYKSYPDIGPGKLTDLRSSAVSNENFAVACVRRNLHPHLLHCSGFLQSQVTEFVRSLVEPHNSSRLQQSIKAPKALGDMVESIAGAMLIDANLNVEKVWRIFEPLLSPIVTPNNLELPSLRKLIELCDYLGYFLKEECVKEGNMVHAELTLQLKDTILLGKGCEPKKKAARGAAAHCLLEKLEERGIFYSECISKRRKHECEDSNISSSVDKSVKIFNEEDSSTNRTEERQKITDCNYTVESSLGGSSSTNNCSKKISISATTPVIGSINKNKGGPRTSLFGLCKTLQWPMPTFKTEETKSRVLIEFGEGSNKRCGFNAFVSKIRLHIPNYGTIECTGDNQPDKKCSFDSAALAMLYLLEQLGLIIINKKHEVA
ncbi:hypothetical protein L6164_003236 [Bauhinia variegata]|uniref:Uncharacterized protein n=1 Tax=Bauhinia variegata TaxID=167791 RepID=A0ACB9Q0S8_BAUVA|nr:hypothetical protein L6164_003236 [Bauhinia variegata]